MKNFKKKKLIKKLKSVGHEICGHGNVAHIFGISNIMLWRQIIDGRYFQSPWYELNALSFRIENVNKQKKTARHEGIRGFFLCTLILRRKLADLLLI